ncbi:MAG: ChaN family lipoprotein [Magnetococcales bacterium]|nr:ChaN family lipoprotein [Magnetococcales bacterium]
MDLISLGLMAGLALFGGTMTSNNGPSMPMVKAHIADLNAQRFIAPGTLHEALAKRRFVLVGETHTDPEHHRVQLMVIQALHKRRTSIAVGMEMFPRAMQPVLDRWIAGNLTEEQFLDESFWYLTWGFDAALYLPILRFLRDERIPLFAMNIERKVVKETRRLGLENLPPDMRRMIPNPAPLPAPYRAELKALYDAHPFMAKGAPFETFAQAQQVWDAVMADSMHQAAQRHPDTLIIGLAGNGHIIDGHGIPHQLRALLDHDIQSDPFRPEEPSPIATVIPWTVDEDYAHQGAADFAWGTMPPPKQSFHGPITPKLGVELPGWGEDSKPGAKIIQVMPDSTAVAIGLKPHDRLTHLNDQPLINAHTLVRLLRNHKSGDIITLALRRNGQRKQHTFRLPDAKPSPHHGMKMKR